MQDSFVQTYESRSRMHRLNNEKRNREKEICASKSLHQALLDKDIVAQTDIALRASQGQVVRII